jgi:hypothetical protein
MPRHFCSTFYPIFPCNFPLHLPRILPLQIQTNGKDYCDIFLTHDTLNVRKDHNSGWKHRMNVQNFYASMDKDKIRLVIEKVSLSYDRRPDIKKDKPEFVPVSDDPNALYGVAKWATLSDNPDGGKRWQRYRGTMVVNLANLHGRWRSWGCGWWTKQSKTKSFSCSSCWIHVSRCHALLWSTDI